MTDQGVIIDVHFTVNCNDFIISRFEQRVDLQHTAIQSNISVVQIGYEFDHIFLCITGQTQVECDIACLESLQGITWFYELFVDFLRSAVCYFFDIHTTFGRVHDNVLFCSAV
ncbi:hypothetical protein D9M68_867370 [compost metagenome]